MRNIVREMGSWFSWDVSRSSWWGWSSNVLRSAIPWSIVRRRPSQDATSITYDLTRALYRNESPQYRYGAGFCKPIVDLPADMMGLPTVTGDDADFLNNAISRYWASALKQMFRDAMRDSKVVVRYYQPRIDNPLFTEEDRKFGCLEVYPPEEVQLLYDPVDKNMLLSATITHWIDMDDRTVEQELAGEPPHTVTHEVVETATPLRSVFYDKTVGAQIDAWTTRNPWGFVAFWTVWNEYAADLGGGISDYEPVMPFIEAFHDVLKTALDAHDLHSIPKIKFKVKSVEQFIANNFPDAVDPETKKVVNGSAIDWKGREIMFFTPDEDADFIEARSVLGDSKVLLDFLLGCICIASETPRFAFFADEQSAVNTAEADPFKKRIERKRVFFGDAISMICKMALVANGKSPQTPMLNWQPVNLQDLVSKGQAIQQLILGLDVASAHGWVADATAIRILKELFTQIAEPDVEMEAAKSNKVVDAAQNPANIVAAIKQLNPPAPTNGATPASANGTGKGLATTKPSKS